MRVDLKVLATCFALVAAVAAIGSIFTTEGIASGWYDAVRPGITPPNIVFPVVWTALYALLALSLYSAWTGAGGAKERRDVAGLYGANLLLNVLWSFVFFGMRLPTAGFAITILLLLSTGAIIWRYREGNASLLMVPYLLWTGFAAYLNYLVFAG
ncbi:MAG: TspO/MBR family protein [Candidatus Bilamarchaeaceae archaeon]